MLRVDWRAIGGPAEFLEAIADPNFFWFKINYWTQFHNLGNTFTMRLISATERFRGH